MMWGAWDSGGHALAAVGGGVNVAWAGSSPLSDVHALINILEEQKNTDEELFLGRDTHMRITTTQIPALYILFHYSHHLPFLHDGQREGNISKTFNITVVRTPVISGGHLSQCNPKVE